MIQNDKLVIGGHEFNSRFILGSGKYSTPLSCLTASMKMCSPSLQVFPNLKTIFRLLWMLGTVERWNSLPDRLQVPKFRFPV